jgi:hypothetical protein
MRALLIALFLTAPAVAESLPELRTGGHKGRVI